MKRGKEMPAIVGHDDAGAGGAGAFRNVDIVDAAADGAVGRVHLQQSRSVGGRQIVHRQTGADFLLKQPVGVDRLEALLRREAGRHRIEFETTVPGRRRGWDRPFHHAVHDELGRRASRGIRGIIQRSR